MKIGIPKERRDDERRAAASPDTVKRYKGLGLEPVVEAGAGDGAAVADQAFADAGATDRSRTAAAWDSDIVLKVQRPTEEEMGRLRQGQVLIGMLDPYNNKEQVEAYAKAGVSAFAHGAVCRAPRAPRPWTCSPARPISPATRRWSTPWPSTSRVLPMMMTAAGTVTPAKVFIVGAGVAGLQAIATARRMGAVVTATDVRPAAARGDREPGRQVRGLRAGRCRDQGRLCPAADARGAGRAGEDGGRASQDPGHRRDHGADPGPQGAADRHRARWSGR